MKPIERVALTLQHKEADRVPVYRFYAAYPENW